MDLDLDLDLDQDLDQDLDLDLGGDLELDNIDNRVFLQPAPCLAPCLVNFSLYKYGAIRSSAPFHLVNLTRSYTELTRSRPQIAPCLAPYGSVFSSVLGKSDKIFKIWKKSKRLKSALNTQLSMKE